MNKLTSILVLAFLPVSGIADGFFPTPNPLARICTIEVIWPFGEPAQVIIHGRVDDFCDTQRAQALAKLLDQTLNP